MIAPDEDDLGPDEDVWNHLDSGWQKAHDDIARKLPAEFFEFYRNLAKLIVQMKSTMQVDVSNALFKSQLTKVFKELPPSSEAAVLGGLLKTFAQGSDRWLTHAVELELASEGITRATGALKRFQDLVPRLGGQEIPERVVPYVRQTVSAFLFGFDDAAIALARSSLEQVAKEVLVRLGVYTVPGLKRARPPLTLEHFILKLKEKDALEHSYDAAGRIRDWGNRVVHDQPVDEKISRRVAIDTIADMTAVLSELLP